MAKNALKGTLKSYLRWPILLAALLIIMNIQIYTINFTAGLVMSGYVLLYLIFAILIYTFKRNVLIKDLVNYAMSFHSKTFNIAKSIDLPICILDPNGNCVWQNKLFASTFSSDLKKNFHITDAIAALTQEYLPEASDKNCELHFTRDDNFFRAVIQRLNTDQQEAEGAPIGIGEDLFAVFVYDETEIVHVIRENYDQRLDICLLYIDNYDESLGAIEEVRRALIAAIIDRKITKHMLKFDAITRRLEKDKYIILFQHKYLSEMQADKFSLLEEIKSTNIAEDKSATISMGIGIQAKTFRKRQEYAQSAIDLALARGGDQVVIKSKDNILYYGGKSVQQEKNTRVKARVKAQALRESIGIADKIVIMGHRLPDVDAIGSAIGINRISQTLGKPTHIVVNEVTSSLSPVLDLFKDNKDFPEDLFVTGEQAKEFMGDGTGVLLIVVDVNKPSYTDSPELIDIASSLVVIDHHRLSDESFKHATLSYIEPFASSTCEMVAEILQYTGEEMRLKTIEADAMYSGIMVDTNNFMNKPGVRTFEAVAYLRRSGADIMRIRKMFRSDISEYKVRAEAIQNMEIFLNCFAIAPCNAENCISPTIVGAKIADDLLDIQGIKATFILTSYEDKIYISARSIDELNVQVVMEKLGGGGHISSAGTQLIDCTIDEAITQIKDILTTMKEEGDIII